jgi:flagellar motor component MotA
MNLNRDFPYLVACYLIAVGLFFILSDILGAAYLSAGPPGKYYLYALAIIFIAAGTGAFILKYQGKLRRSGKTIKEVRLQAIENLNDAALLANIALEQDDEQIQNAAQERLKDLNH